MAGENDEIQKRRGFNGLAGVGGLPKRSVIRLNSAAAQPIEASASFDHKWVGRKRRERRTLRAPLTAVHAPRSAATKPVKNPRDELLVHRHAATEVGHGA